MSKRTTISVPDILYEKMDAWRGKINFSKVFQKAVSELIQSKEAFQKRMKGDPNMDEIIERLKEEKMKSEKTYFERGKIDGLEFAKRANYNNLQYALRWETVREMDSNTIGTDPTRDEILGEYFGEEIENDDLMDFEETQPGYYMPNRYYQEWESGWKEGVQEFWELIKDKID